MRMLKGEVHKSLLASEIDVLKTFKQSKNIIEVYDIYTTKNNTYIITEFCDGGDLSKLISSRRGLPEKEAVDFSAKLAFNSTTLRWYPATHSSSPEDNWLSWPEAFAQK